MNSSDNKFISDNIAKVYDILLIMLISYSVAIWLQCNLMFNIGFVILNTILSFLMVILIIFTKTYSYKFLYSNILAGSMGIISGHTVLYANYINKLIVPTAIFYTFVIFGVFSLVGHFNKSKEKLLVKGFLYNCLIILVMISLMNLYCPFGEFIEMIYLLFGLILFCGYITYDTYLMYDRFSKGDFDHYLHALNLFLDIINIFLKLIRLLLLFTKRKSE